MVEELDFDALNRLRASLGLAPGPSFKENDDKTQTNEEIASTLETREAAATDNWNKLQEELKAKEKRKSQKEAIKKARELSQRNARLAGPTLGDEDEELDTRAWAKGYNKRQDDIKKKRQHESELAEKERLKKVEYTSKDLAGVKVGHEFDQIETGGEHVLTLKDAEIGDESEDDELENIDIRQNELLKKKMELKKKKPVYNPTDDDGSGGLLQQYNEEINGPIKHRFTLDGEGSTTENLLKSKEMEDDKSSKGIKISLDIFNEKKPISDYVDISEIKIKKPKKSKSKSSRKRVTEDNDIFDNQDLGGHMDVDLPLNATSNKRSYDDTNLVDDDDMQSRLSKQRREALKKRKKMKPEDLAQILREEEENEMQDLVDENYNQEVGLIIDETSEFVSRLKPEEMEQKAQKNGKSKQAKPQLDNKENNQESDDDVDMDESYAALENKEDESNYDNNNHTNEEDDNNVMGLEEDRTLDQGIGSALNLLRQRNLLKEERDTEGLNKNYRNHEQFLADKRSRIEQAGKEAKSQRERDRQSGKLDRMSQREREEYARNSNIRREKFEGRAMEELYNKEYTPNFEIKHVDEFGRRMNQKEAFKHLSHQFHGKGSGKQKLEKKLKKIEEEKKREAVALLNSSQHTSVGNKSKKNQQAGVRLQ